MRKLVSRAPRSARRCFAYRCQLFEYSAVNRRAACSTSVSVSARTPKHLAVCRLVAQRGFGCNAKFQNQGARSARSRSLFSQYWSALSPVAPSGKLVAMHSVHVKAAFYRRLLPNPSLKRTPTGWPLRVVVYPPLRGQPAVAA
jgi:hypothetical protein